jgi:hypothetical protein
MNLWKPALQPILKRKHLSLRESQHYDGSERRRDAPNRKTTLHPHWLCAMKIRKTSSEYDRLTVLTYHSHHSTWNMLPMNVIFQCPLQEVSRASSHIIFFHAHDPVR